MMMDETPDASRAVVVISGGSRGLGMVIANCCLREGHIVATYSRTDSPFVREQFERDPTHRDFYWAAVDAADSASVKRFVSRVVEQYGHIGAVINNAGIGV